MATKVIKLSAEHYNTEFSTLMFVSDPSHTHTHTHAHTHTHTHTHTHSCLGACLHPLCLQMREVCLAHLEEGQPKDWSAELKYEIITKHIAGTEDLQEILHSKRTWWSTFVGFWQWLLWRLKTFQAK